MVGPAPPLPAVKYEYSNFLGFGASAPNTAAPTPTPRPQYLSASLVTPPFLGSTQACLHYSCFMPVRGVRSASRAGDSAKPDQALPNTWLAVVSTKMHIAAHNGSGISPSPRQGWGLWAAWVATFSLFHFSACGRLQHLCCHQVAHLPRGKCAPWYQCGCVRTIDKQPITGQ
jgi:hypothetical protein